MKRIAVEAFAKHFFSLKVSRHNIRNVFCEEFPYRNSVSTALNCRWCFVWIPCHRNQLSAKKNCGDDLTERCNSKKKTSWIWIVTIHFQRKFQIFHPWLLVSLQKDKASICCNHAHAQIGFCMCTSEKQQKFKYEQNGLAVICIKQIHNQAIFTKTENHTKLK